MVSGMAGDGMSPPGFDGNCPAAGGLGSGPRRARAASPDPARNRATLPHHVGTVRDCDNAALWPVVTAASQGGTAGTRPRGAPADRLGMVRAGSQVGPRVLGGHRLGRV